MQRRGKTAAGTQRWFCSTCLKSGIKNNPWVVKRHKTGLFIRWLCGNATLSELARKHRLTQRTLQRHFKPLWKQLPSPQIPQSLRDQSLILDAVSIESRRLMALIGRTRNHVVNWTFAERESYESWLCFCSQLPEPHAVVCDGQRGLLAAIMACWPIVPIQRCIIHVIRQAQAKLTCHPKTLAGKDLRQLAKAISTIRTRRQKRRWIRRWQTWCRKYHRFLAERSYSDIQNRKRSWWYTHRKIRAVRSLIRNSLPHLFTFIGHPEIPRTSNHVEGGINSRLKELLHRHRGLSLSRKQILSAWFLTLKSIQKPPRNVY